MNQVTIQKHSDTEVAVITTTTTIVPLKVLYNQLANANRIISEQTVLRDAVQSQIDAALSAGVSENAPVSP